MSIPQVAGWLVAVGSLPAANAMAQGSPVPQADVGHMGIGNFVVLLTYLAGMLSIGLWCSRKNTSTEQYFVASRKIPGWAAGISVFGTQLSAITFITVPGTSFKEDWVRFLASIVL